MAYPGEKQRATVTFLGMNNVEDPARLKQGQSPFLLNVDATDTGTVVLRPSSPYTGDAALAMSCLYNGRQYTADGADILFGKSILGSGENDLGGVLTTMDSGITLLAEVTDGIYCGSDDELLFFSGGDPMLGDMSMRVVLDYGVVANTCCRVENKDIGIESPGTSLVFLTKKGICIASASGQAMNVTDGTVAIPACTAGCSATVRKSGNMSHYVVRVSDLSTPDDQYIPVTPTDT